MELITCLVLAVCAFVLLVTSIIGLVSAPTPILLAILVGGVLFTQKSIDKLTEVSVNLMEERNKNRIEKVDIAFKDVVDEDKQKTDKSMIYRGFNYNRTANGDKTPNYKPSRITHYRGAVIDNRRKDIV
jgi:cobalamin biosynthesis protein CobD/CbiB